MTDSVIVKKIAEKVVRIFIKIVQRDIWVWNDAGELATAEVSVLGTHCKGVTRKQEL